jgi:hypothetical protein
MSSQLDKSKCRQGGEFGAAAAAANKMTAAVQRKRGFIIVSPRAADPISSILTLFCITR